MIFNSTDLFVSLNSFEQNLSTWICVKINVYKLCHWNLFAPYYIIIVPKMKKKKTLNNELIYCSVLCVFHLQLIWLQKPCRTRLPWSVFIFVSLWFFHCMLILILLCSFFSRWHNGFWTNKKTGENIKNDDDDEEEEVNRSWS